VDDLSAEWDEFRTNIVGNLAAISSRIDAVEASTRRLRTEPRAPLSEEQRRELQVTWSKVVCATCGTIHPGMCPRVRETNWHPNGTIARQTYWPNAEWEPPRDAIRAEDVFPGGVPDEEKGDGS